MLYFCQLKVYLAVCFNFCILFFLYFLIKIYLFKTIKLNSHWFIFILKDLFSFLSALFSLRLWSIILRKTRRKKQQKKLKKFIFLLHFPEKVIEARKRKQGRSIFAFQGCMWFLRKTIFFKDIHIRRYKSFLYLHLRNVCIWFLE